MNHYVAFIEPEPFPKKCPNPIDEIMFIKFELPAVVSTSRCEKLQARTKDSSLRTNPFDRIPIMGSNYTVTICG
jgi:hypothetical protein